VDPILNPFTPGAGVPPRALVGRDRELEQAAILFGRLRMGNPDRSIVLTGLRGVGKTVLLGRMRRLAGDQGWLTATFEARDEIDLREELAAAGQSFLETVDPLARGQAAVAQLRSWLPRLSVADGAVGLELGTPAAQRLESDVVGLIDRLGQAARASDVGIAFFVDELQDTPAAGLAAICAAMHRAAQDVTPVAFVGAGLPTLPGLMAAAKSYAERLFTYPEIGPLPPEKARLAIREALEDLALPDGGRPTIEDDALARCIDFAGGYPMFLQAIGKHAWARAAGPAIVLDDVRGAEQAAFDELSHDLFRARWQRATPRQRDYLTAIAEAGGRVGSAAAAGAAGYATPAAASPVREELISKGIVYPPARGEIAFTVPRFERFVSEQLEREGVEVQ
jgi:AAA ATPase domain